MTKWNYGVILDAGSSGTRLHVYRWLKPSKARKYAKDDQLHSLPEIKTKKRWTKKVHPGVSTFADNAGAVGPNHLAPLLEHALDVVPRKEVGNTPIYLLATAGMRLLPDMQQKSLLREICHYVKDKTQFHVADCQDNIRIITGETEGLYGWMATNYLLGGFDHPADHNHGQIHQTYGFLDMGGASAQIAFAPNSTESIKHGDDLTLVRMRTIDGIASEHRVFVTSWLGFGAKEARQRYIDHLLESTEPDAAGRIPDPCLPNGLEMPASIQPVTSSRITKKQTALQGTGRFAECLASTIYLLDKNAACSNPPCLFHGSHVPAIDFAINHFVGVSEYWHMTHDIFESAFKDKAYDFQTYQNRVTQFCGQDWHTIQKDVKHHKWGKKVDEQSVSEACFKASWMINMLHEGIGVPRVGLETDDANHHGVNGTKAMINAAKEGGFLAPFQAVNKIDNTEVSWTLGKMVLYASSQIPAANPSVQEVGFQINAAGVSLPFQFGGGTVEVVDSGAASGKDGDKEDFYDNDDDFDEGDWRSRLFSSSRLPDRTPGFILFLIIVVLVGVLLCGRERRKNLAGKVTGLFHRRSSSNSSNASMGRRRHRRGVVSKLPFNIGRGSRDNKYERLQEEGVMPHPGEFELQGGIMSSSDDEGDSRSSHASSSSSSSSSKRLAPTIRKTAASASSTDLTSSHKDTNGSISSAGTATAAQGVGLGLVGASGTFESRVETRERLDRLERLAIPSKGESSETGHGTGHRTRNASPTRFRSPIMSPWKDSID